nr:hypothetical protein [Tanacetum cinerariifolium]
RRPCGAWSKAARGDRHPNESGLDAATVPGVNRRVAALRLPPTVVLAVQHQRRQTGRVRPEAMVARTR